MKSKPSFVQVLLGLVALQIGVMSVGGSPTKSEVFTWNQAINLLQNRHFVEGSSLPKLTLKDEKGALLDVAFPATLVFRGACSCEDVAVGNWMESAKSSDVKGVLVCVGDEMPLSEARWLAAPSQQVGKCRSDEFTFLLVKNQELPFVVHVNAQGVIASWEGMSK